MQETYDAKIAQWTREVLDRHNITSSRQAEIRTRGQISYSTIQNMLNGRRVKDTLVIKFANSFGEDIPAALRLFGYEEMAGLWEGSRLGGPAASRELLTGEIQEVLEEIAAGVGEAPLNPEVRALLKEIAESIVSMDPERGLPILNLFKQQIATHQALMRLQAQASTSLDQEAGEEDDPSEDPVVQAR